MRSDSGREYGRATSLSPGRSRSLTNFRSSFHFDYPPCDVRAFFFYRPPDPTRSTFRTSCALLRPKHAMPTQPRTMAKWASAKSVLMRLAWLIVQRYSLRRRTCSELPPTAAMARRAGLAPTTSTHNARRELTYGSCILVWGIEAGECVKAGGESHSVV